MAERAVLGKSRSRTAERISAISSESARNPRTARMHRHLAEVYSIADESTPEGKVVAGIGHQLEDVKSRRKIKYRIIHNNQVNAFALEDTVYIFSGLINAFHSSDELAAVVATAVAAVEAHEISHIEKGDTEQKSLRNAESFNDALRQASKPRIAEYTADAAVAEKLNSAGYNPAVYQKVLKLFHELSPGMDFSHGNAQDRQSGQRMQFRAKDYETTAILVPDIIPDAISYVYLVPKLRQHKFDEIIDVVLSGREPDRERELLKGLSAYGILEFHAHVCAKVEKLIDQTQGPLGTYVPFEADALLSFIGQIDREVVDRISKNFPEFSPEKILQTQVILYTQVMDKHFGEFSSLYKKLEASRAGSSHQYVRYDEQLLKTLRTKEDLITFAQFARDHQVLAQLGYDIQEEPFPDKLFSIHPRDEVTEKDMFLYKALEKFFPDPFAYDSAFKYVQELGSTLGVTNTQYIGSQELPRRWALNTLNAIYDNAIRAYIQKMHDCDPDAFDTNPEEANLKYMSTIKDDVFVLANSFLTAAQPYIPGPEAEYINAFISFNVASRLLAYFGFDQKDKTQLTLEFKKTRDKNFAEFVSELESENTEQMMALFKKIGCRSFVAYAEEAKLAFINPTLAFDVMNRVVFSIQSEDYELQEADKRFIFELVLGSSEAKDKRLTTPKLQKWREKYETASPKSYDEALAEIGVGKTEAQTLLLMEVRAACTFGGNPQIAYEENQRIIRELPVERLSDEVSVIYLDQLSQYPSLDRIGSPFSGKNLTWRENIDYDPKWALVLQESNMIALRDRYTNIWMQQSGSLSERVKHVRQLSDRFGEYATEFYNLGGGWFGLNTDVGKFLEAPVSEIMRQISENPMNMQSVETLKDLYAVVEFLDDKRLTAQLKVELEYRIVKLMVFEEATAFIQNLLDSGEYPVKAIQYYQEHLVQTPDHLVRAEQILEKFGRRLHDEGNSEVTAAAAFDFAFEQVLSEKSLDFFEAAMESQFDDTKLRTILGDQWFATAVIGKGDAYYFELPLPRTKAEPKLTGPAQYAFVPFEKYVKNFYQKLTPTQIDVMLRKMLISRKGVLMTPEGRRSLHTLLMKQVTEHPQDVKLRQLISTIVEGGLETMDPVEFYEPLAKILRTRLFLAPEKAGSNAQAITAARKSAVEIIKRDLEQAKSFIGYAKSTYHRTRAEQQYEKLREVYEGNMPTLQGMSKVFSFDPFRREEELAVGSRSIIKAKERLRTIVGLPDRERELKQLEPLDLVLEFSKNMGAVGVRFLQLLGQYIEIDERYQEKFDEVYDRVQGQLKFTAYQTLHREATKETASLELKEFWGNLHSLSPTLAGGSTMTVYRALMNDGSTKIVKVLNPNAENFIRETINDTRAIIEYMRRTQPTEKLFLVETLVDDLEAWLVADINTTDYEHDNVIFEQVNNGFTLGPKGQQVVVQSPTTVKTGTKYIKIEDEVEGENLSELLHRKDPRTRAYVELAIASFEHQLQTISDGGKNVVHSDVHMGNIRIGYDQKLYWIDRGYYLRMPQEEVDIIMPLLKGNFDPMIGLQAVQYLLGLPENAGHNSGEALFTDLLATISKATEQNKSQLAVVNDVLVTLKQHGVHIPLRIGLLFKNVKALSTMAQKVGLRYP